MKRGIDKFHLMTVFNKVAMKSSFTLAAKELGMTVSSVSKAVQQLEYSLGTKLLFRTTRNQSLTDSGHAYLKASSNILLECRRLEENIYYQSSEPFGNLKIAAPTALGQFLISPSIHKFMKLYPKIKVELILGDNLIDITEQGVDLAIRSRNASEMSQYYSINLGSRSRRVVSSPEYISEFKTPITPKELGERNLLNYQGRDIDTSWSFKNGAQSYRFQPKSIYTSNNYYSVYKAAINGVGIANLYQYLVDEDIKAGNLVELLPNWQQERSNIYGVFQQRRESSPKLDVFLSFISELLN